MNQWRLKGPTRPTINNEIDRAEMLSGLKSSRFYSYFWWINTNETLRKIKPSIHKKVEIIQKSNAETATVKRKMVGEVIILSSFEGKLQLT